MLRRAALLPLLLVVSGRALANVADGAVLRGRTPFVVGAPGRLAGAGDRRLPRIRQRAESLIAAYADVEEVDDPTWLAQEVESYVRAATECQATATDWCRREVRRVGADAIIFFAAGAHAEAVWVAGGNRAVRLGWTRIVDTPSGTMTVDAPPADLLEPLLGELPSRLVAFTFDAARDRNWAAAEIDRFVYYVEQDEQRRHAIAFVASNLARISRLRAPRTERPRYEGDDPTSADGLPASLAEELEAVRAWRSGAGPQSVADQTGPWCALSAGDLRSPMATAPGF